jgi:hypothetical protein
MAAEWNFNVTVFSHDYWYVQIIPDIQTSTKSTWLWLVIILWLVIMLPPRITHRWFRLLKVRDYFYPHLCFRIFDLRRIKLFITLCISLNIAECREISPATYSVKVSFCSWYLKRVISIGFIQMIYGYLTKIMCFFSECFNEATWWLIWVPSVSC